MRALEEIADRGKPLAYIIHGDLNPDRTTFLVPPECNLQVGFVVYPTGGEIARHTHCALERHIVGTPEVLVVRKGHCEVAIYNEARDHVATRELRPGDILVIVAGGHGFRMFEDTVLLEVKQGPYIGLNEKERF